MKKQSLVLAVIALVIGILVGVIYSNLQKDTGGVTPPTSSAPPVVNHQQQISMLEGIVAKEPNNRNAWVQLGHNFFDSDQPMKAIDAYGKALELDGNDPDTLTDQGVMFRRVGWFDKAIANFNKANELNPNHIQSLYNLGIVYRYDLKDLPKAAKAWQQLLEINPTAPGADQIRAELEFIKNHPQIPQQPK